ncbi:putative selenate ABC transporter substrate-binding protein [Anaeromyxobacter oryzisoli]|uniref:putative selenate ABC transporter substrate-binding protein n=1 Tax=Anaeromyxobacter oryzisoli TaxID=2925408 RepID=UPI001F56259E|nr:putative selenate ABC transporter substrate-binding protein [Anaeromyxobacter sp. SG63]
MTRRSETSRMKLLAALGAVALALALAVLLTRPAGAQGKRALRVTAIPDEAPNELIRKFEPLGAYLSSQLGMPVKFVPVTDYPAVVEALAGGHVDLAWLGGFTFVQARRRTGNAVPLVQREEDAHFHSKFITRAGSGIATLADLKGKTFAFGSPSSTSGHLMPRHFLLEAGVDPDQAFSRYAFSGAHDATAKWVEGGKVDAGALNESVWKKLVDEKKIDPAKVVVFYTTPEFHDYNWTVRGDLDPKLVQKIKAAFLALDPANPQHKKILDLQRASRFIEARPEDYAGIESAARSAGLVKD